MINVSNNYKQALTQPRTIDAKITYDSTTINIDDINSIKRSFNSTLFKTIAKQVIIDSNVSIDKDKTINPQFGLYLDNQFEYVSLGSYKTKDAPNLNKDTNSYETTAYDKIVESMVSYELTESDITYPCSVRQLFVAIFTKLGWSTSGIPSTFVNSTSMIEEDVYSNVNMTYRDVLDELCTISCMFLIDINGTPTLKQKTTTSETINEDFMGDTNVQIKNQVFFNSLVFSRASNSDNIYRKDDASITTNGLHEFKVSDLQILSLNWRDNFIDAMWNYIKTFTYYAYEINTIGITYLEPIDTFTLSTFGSTYSTILLNSDLTIANGVNEKIYANEPLESETEYKYADTTDKRINQTYLIVDKQQGQINAVVSQVDEIEQELANPTSIKQGEYFDLEDALDEPLIDFSLYGQTQQDSTPTPDSPQPIHNVSGDNTIEICGKNLAKSKYVDSTTTNYAKVLFVEFAIKPNTTYTISFNGTNGNKIYSNEKIFTTSSYITIDNNRTIVALTTQSEIPTSQYTSGRGWALFKNQSGNTNANVFDNLQIEKSSTATEYEPYTGNSQLISLGTIELNKISTYQDYIYKEEDRWYLHKEIGKVVLNGSESWSYNSQYTFFYTTSFTLTNTNVYTNYYKYYPTITGITGSYGCSVYQNTFRIKNTDYTQPSDLKTWLQSHNTIVYYVLATPTDTEITDTTLLEQLNRLMTLPLYKNMTHITLTPNDLQPTMKIEYYRDTDLNNSFVPKTEMSKYYTKTETIAQIQIGNSSIQQNVAEIQTTLDSNGEAINTISNQVQTLQSSTSLQISAINTQLENGVEKLTNSLVRIDTNGINTSKQGETFNTQITNKTFEVKDGTRELAFIGYDNEQKRTVARMDDLESKRATIGVHRAETITKNGKKRTAWFYVGGGN